SPDGNRFYFTRCERNWKNKMICSIYQSTKEANTWSIPVALPKIINNPKYTSTQPAVATFSKRDEEILYFVSDRKGGRGGLDIWYTQFKKKQNIWTEPKNCGNKINTSGNEVTPFVEMENRTLHFSSDGMCGWGQLDIFKSTGELSKWMPCENLKTPINSPFDDLYFNLNKNLTDGFIVSNRPSKTVGKTSTCCDDILIFKFDEVIRIKAIGTVYARIDKSFKKMFEDKFDSDQSTSDAMNADSSFQLAAGTVATLFIIDDTAPMGSGNMIYIKSDTIDINGNYSFNLDAGKEYVIEIENYGYYKPRLNISTFMYTQSDTMYLDTLSIDIMPKQPLIVKNIYYEFGESELSYKAKKILDSTLLTLLQENTQLIIEVSSHTDNKGRTKLNKDLSQERAIKVVGYLIKKGIDKERLYAVGYGETKPIAPNETSDGKDNPDGREKNRRTEFKIIGSLNQYSEIIYEE
ncbi:MAG: OmpA family protein, partial [Bacteroidales bacterium]|nr:OmpA family protein [Bacteroidales bacterium]